MNNEERLFLNKQKYEGNVLDIGNYGKIEILKYENKRNVFIKFIETGNTSTVTLNNLINGRIKDYYAKTVCGVGYLGDLEKGCAINSKIYDIWRQMLTRCYDERFYKKRPTYEDCTTSENFKNFSYFNKWCYSQVGFGKDGWNLDKDILIKGNKVYSEDTCCFVPPELNNTFVKSDKKRGGLPIGVSFVKKYGKYKAGISMCGVVTHIGTYSTSEEAFQAYKQAKEDYIKSLANKYKDQIDSRVYEALMNYQVEITD